MSSDEFARQITKQAIARACVALGFKNAESTVLDVLSDVMRNYIEKVAASSVEIAELHGRAKPGIQDTFVALENLKPTRSTLGELRDFAFAESVSTGSKASSSSYPDASASSAAEVVEIDAETVASVNKSGSLAWHQPFPHIVPNFPVRQKLKAEIHLPDEQVTRGTGVPTHLPAYPPVHTYKRSHGNKKRPYSSLSKDQNDSSQRTLATINKSLTRIEDGCDEA